MSRKILAVVLTIIMGSLLPAAKADITTGLVGYWSFDDGAPSATAADASSNANTGTLTGFSDSSFTSMWTSTAWFTNAIIFNQGSDTGDYVSIPDIAQLDFGAVSHSACTISAWVFDTQPANIGGAIVCKGNGGGPENYCLDIASSKFRFFTHNAAGSSTITATASVGPTQGAWMHVVGTFQEPAGSSTVAIYVNGVLSGSSSGTFTTMENSNHVVSIGNRQTASTGGTYNIPFHGIIDDVRIYNRALTSNDVFQLYTNNGALNGHAPPPITTQPRSVSAYFGDSPGFSVAAAQTNIILPVFYQWQLNGTNITGATGATYQVFNAQATNAGTYTALVYNYVGTNVSSNAVLTLNSLPAADPTTGLVGWWKFDDASGSTMAADSTGNGDAGTVSDFADGTYSSMWTGGLIGGAMAFNLDNTSQDVVAIPSIGTPTTPTLDFSANGTYTNGTLTLAAWVRGSVKQSNGAGIIARGTGNGGEQYVLDIENIPGASAPIPGYFRFFVRDANGVATQTAPTTIGPNENWQHVAGVLNLTNGIMNLYVNGTLVAAGIAPFSLQTGGHEVSIGNRQPGTGAYGSAFFGLLDDVRIYNRDLTSADLAALYQQGAAYPAFTSSTPPGTMPPVTYTNIYTTFVGAANPSFSVRASGSPTLSYRWFTNGVAIQGATGTNVTLTGLGAGMITNYCVVSNSLGAATNVWLLDVISTNSYPPYPLAVLASTPVAYWRLDEPDDGRANGNAGAIANDYIGGHNGVYTNVNLGLTPGYNTGTDPNATAAKFGAFATANSYVGQISGINFGAGAGTNVNFSVETWVNASTTPGAAASMVTQGEYAVNDMFSLSFSSSSPYFFRFYVREAGGGVATATATSHPDGNWHHVVGVCDESDGLVVIYVDGVSNTSVTIPTASGLSTAPNTAVIIGAGTDNATNNYDKQVSGEMSDVAIYNYALTPAEVAAHFNAEGVGPAFTLPSSINISQGDTLVLTPTVTTGTPPLTFSWADSNNSLSGAQLSTETLTVSNISVSDTYNLTINNSYAPFSASGSTSVNVISNATIFSDITPLSATVYAGTPVTFSITAYGLLPLSFQWFNGGGSILNATNTTYTATTAVGTNTYYCVVSNNSSTSPQMSSTATLIGILAPTNLYPKTVLSNNPIAYWRLDEPDNGSSNGNPGVIVNDYVGQHDGTYNNVILGVAGYNAIDPDTAALFGAFAAPNSYAGETDNSGSGIPNIDFTKTEVGGNAEFSVEAWVKATNSQSTGAGIVSRGYNSGGEQFVLDCNGDKFRFYFRDGASQVITCQSGMTDNDGKWHHLAGVCDQLNGGAHFYVDGTDTADAFTEAGKGVIDPSGATLQASDLVSIGSRAASKTASTLADQFVGTIDEVALYTNALTAAQVQAHYNAGVPPTEVFTMTNLHNGQVQLNWTFGTLQVATNGAGPYSSITNATSPYVVPATNGHQFYRVLE